MLNIDYAATTNDNVVGTASPAGQVNAIVGSGTLPVTVTFTTDDGRAATGLTLTSFDSLARPTDARNNPAAAPMTAQVPLKLEPIVVTAKRFTATRSLPTLR